MSLPKLLRSRADVDIDEMADEMADVESVSARVPGFMPVWRALVYCVIVALFGCASPEPMPQRLSIPPLPLTFLAGLTMQESRVMIDAREKAGGQWDIRVDGTRMHPEELQKWAREIAMSYFGMPRTEAGLLRRLRIRIDAEVDPYVTGIREVRLVTASEIHLVVGIPDPKKFSGPDLPLYPPAR